MVSNSGAAHEETYSRDLGMSSKNIEALTLQWDSAELPENCFHRILSTKNGNGIMVA